MRIAHFLGLLAFCSLSAFAQGPQRTFVSTTGNDANSCLRTSPCRNFAAALTAVANGGEVIVLDSGGYGAVTLNKFVSLIAPGGVYAGVTGFSGSAITVNAPAGIVIIRGLSINALGAVDGIDIVDAGEVHIENVQASLFTGGAVHVRASFFTMRDCEIRDNTNGVLIDETFGISGSIDRSRFDNNVNRGIEMKSGNLTVRDSVFFQNSEAVTLNPASTTADVLVSGCVISNGIAGVEGAAPVSGFAIIRVSNTHFYQTNYALYESGSGPSNFFQSYANNTFAGNSSDGAFDATILEK